jgi:outer membrane protein OmpA-like peptidoglycan-associated protein
MNNHIELVFNSNQFDAPWGLRMKEVVTLILSLLALFSLASCANKNVVVLLPGPEGKASHILVSNKGGNQLLTMPNQATSIPSQNVSPSAPFQMTDENIRANYGEALSALPPSPIHFILYFKSDSTELTEESRKLLDEILSTTLSRKSTDVSVVGHTDRFGTREYNYKLGLERAGRVKKILVSQGIDPDFVEVTSHGEDNPLVKTDDEVAEPRNRRVEVVVR